MTMAMLRSGKQRFGLLLSSVVASLFLLTCSIATSQAEDTEIPGENYPLCVEVVEVIPPPNSLLPKKFDPIPKTYRVQFALKFSKPVLIQTRYGSSNNKVFLTTNQYNFTVYRANAIVYSQTSRREITAAFQIPPDVILIARHFYLVVDGGSFYSYQVIGNNKYPVYVPLSIFGRYFVSQEANVVPTPLEPSPYCFPRVKRPFPMPTYGDSESSNTLTVHIPESSHKLLGQSQEEFTLRVNAVLRGSGEGKMALPSTVLAVYKGVNVSVRLPPWTLSFQKQFLGFKVPVNKKIVFELRERIYHQTGMKAVPLEGRPFPVGLNEASLRPRTLLSRSRGQRKSWGIELHDPESDQAIEAIYSEEDSLTSPPVSGEVEYNRWLHRKNLATMKWFTLSSTASAYAKYPTKDSLPPRKKSYMDNSVRECAPNKRNKGRYGKMWHTVELGPFYHMLTVSPILRHWRIERKFEVLAIMENGTTHDLTRRAAVGAFDIPPKMIEALKKYVCLIRPLKTTWRQQFWKTEPLESCIFVPREIAESQQCGGLRLRENISVVFTSDFCDKPFGDCIGLPYTSVERFPIIPPYGLPELAGWYLTGQTPTFIPGKTTSLHPIGRHMGFPSHQFVLPRAFVLHHTRDKLWLRPYQFADSELDVNIPLSGVDILGPGLEGPGGQTVGPKFCSAVWEMDSLLRDKGNEMEAILSATVNNPGEGGSEFIFEVKCTPKLRVKPSSGQIRLWVPEVSQTTVKFRLDGSLVARSEMTVHKCELSVLVNSIPELSTESNCTKWIKTYYGAFEEACLMPASLLPHVDLKYYNLPTNQRRHSTKLAMERFSSSPAGRTLVFVKAVSVSLSVPTEEEEMVYSYRENLTLYISLSTAIAIALSLDYPIFPYCKQRKAGLSNLHELKVYCRSPHIRVLLEDQLLHEASQSAQDTAMTTRKLLSFYTDFTARRRLYYFASQEWFNSSSTKFSACKIEVWANRPHRMCSKQSEKQAEVYVPLGESDVEAIEALRTWKFWYLAPVYGEQTDGIAVALIMCLTTTVVLIVTTATGHGILYAFRKKLPKAETVRRLERELEKVKKSDKEQWEDPQMYLTSGPHGPYFLLHNFRATGALDSEDMKSLKVAGTLRYKSKELQVMFGHVKKVFLDKSNGNGKDVWVQASSGMYHLPFQNITEEYQMELVGFLQRHGITIEKDTAVPTEGNNAPTEGNDAPTEGNNVPTEGNDAPTEGNDAPTDGNNVGGGTTKDNDDVPQTLDDNGDTSQILETKVVERETEDVSGNTKKSGQCGENTLQDELDKIESLIDLDSS